jgi:chemotaxis-related protein WspD
MSGIFERPLPAGYRDELRELTAERPAEAQPRQGSILLFRLGGLQLALPTRVASAVAPVLHIARIPHRSGTVLLGLAAFRGDILPCCSLSRILDLPEGSEQAATARTLILEESPGRRWAAPIDGVLGVRTRRGAASDAAAPIAGHWVQGSFADDVGVYHLLDAEVLFRQITLATA